MPTGQAHSPAPQSLARLPIEPRRRRPSSRSPSTATAAWRWPSIGSAPAASSSARTRSSATSWRCADGSARDAHRLYRLLADEAGLEPAYPTHHPDVQARRAPRRHRRSGDGPAPRLDPLGRRRQRGAAARPSCSTTAATRRPTRSAPRVRASGAFARSANDVLQTGRFIFRARLLKEVRDRPILRLDAIRPRRR